MVYGGLRILHIALGGYYTAAGYFYLVGLNFIVGASGGLGWFYKSFAILFALTSVVGLTFLVELAVYRPLYQRNAPPLVTFVASLGVYLVTINIIGLYFGDETRLLSETSTLPPSHFGGLIVTHMQFLQLCVSMVLLVVAFLILHKTALGRNIRALADNPTLFGVFGYDIRRTRILVLSLSSLLAVSASLLKGMDVGVNPHVGLSAVLSGAVAMMIGAVNSARATLVAALLLGITQNVVIYYLSGQWSDAATFVFLIAVLTFRREGLFAPASRVEET